MLTVMTLLPQLTTVQERFGIQPPGLVGDRGMISQTQTEEVRGPRAWSGSPPWAARQSGPHSDTAVWG